MKQRDEQISQSTPAVEEEEMVAEEAPPLFVEEILVEENVEFQKLEVKTGRRRTLLLTSALLLGIGVTTWFVARTPTSHDIPLDYYVTNTPSRSHVAELERAIAASPWVSTAALLGVTAALLIGAVLYVVFVGSRSARKLRQDALEKAEQIYSLLNDTAPLVAQYEERMAQRMHAVPAAKMRAFGSLKRVLRALEHRLKEVEPYISSWRLGDVERAHMLLNQALVVEESVFEWVIDSDEIPPLDLESVPREIETLVKKLSEERP